jgi:hypothetical protein
MINSPNPSVYDYSKQRVDFVKRFFAVVVSVGFATQLSKIIFAQGAEQVDLSGWRGIVLLLASLVLVVGSWEGYLHTVQGQPLKLARFCLDILIVIMYLVLMLLSRVATEWFWVLAIIFLLYLLWDGLAICEARAFPRDAPHRWNIVITASWLLAAIVLALWENPDTVGGFVCDGLAAVWIIVAYRADQEVFRWNWWPRVGAICVPCILIALGRFVF